MPTSATGICNPDNSRLLMRAGSNHASGQHGFTLIEILVVLFIIGITLTFATLAVTGRNAGDRLQTEATRLQALLQVAGEDAVLNGVELGLDITKDGYRFLRLDSDGWQPITASDTPLHPRKLDADMSLRLVRHEKADVPGRARQADSDNDDNDSDQSDKDSGPRPEVLFFSSGELSPFELELRADDTQLRFRYTGKLTGKIKMKRENS